MNGNYVTVDLDAICDNLQILAKRTETQVCGVIKADAYGHGAVAVAKAIAPYCHWMRRWSCKMQDLPFLF